MIPWLMTFGPPGPFRVSFLLWLPAVKQSSLWDLWEIFFNYVCISVCKYIVIIYVYIHIHTYMIILLNSRALQIYQQNNLSLVHITSTCPSLHLVRNVRLLFCLCRPSTKASNNHPPPPPATTRQSSYHYHHQYALQVSQNLFTQKTKTKPNNLHETMAYFPTCAHKGQ